MNNNSIWPPINSIVTLSGKFAPRCAGHKGQIISVENEMAGIKCMDCEGEVVTYWRRRESIICDSLQERLKFL